MEKENARIAKKERRGAIAKKVVDIYSHDLDYRFLYEGVLYFFAVFLKTDMQHLNYRLTRKINLAAKWCPSTDSSFDRSTMLNESIAKKVIPGSKRHVMLIVFAINWGRTSRCLFVRFFSCLSVLMLIDGIISYTTRLLIEVYVACCETCNNNEESNDTVLLFT